MLCGSRRIHCYGCRYLGRLVEGIMILTGKIDTDGKGNPLAD